MVDLRSQAVRLLRCMPPAYSEGIGRRGAIAVFTALAMTVLIGMVGFAMNFGAAFAQRESLQKVADSAAMAGGVSWVKTNSSAAVTATINSVVVANGYSLSNIQSAGTGYRASSPKNTNLPAVQVTLVATTATPLKSSASTPTTIATTVYSAVEIGTSATAPPSGIACVLSLSTLMMNGSLTATGCTVVANSTSSQAVTINSGSTLSSYGVQTPGGITVNGTLTETKIVTGSGVTANGGATVTGTKSSGGTAVADPFGSSTIHDAAAAGFTNCQNYSGQTTLTPGCWSNVNVNTGTLTLNSGTFFFTGLNVNSGASVSGTGVTIVTQQSFSPNGNITLTAPSTGTFAGIAMYLIAGMNVNSGVTYNVSGAIYAPNNAVIPNNGTWNQGACTYLVAQSITLNSGATFTLPQTNCSSYGYPTANVGAASTTITLAQ